MGRLSNPAEPLETLTPQGIHGTRRSPERWSRQPIHSLTGSESAVLETRGRLSNPAPRTVQRRLWESEVESIAVDYQAGRSIRSIAEDTGIQHHTVAAHLERLGINRRRNPRKLSVSSMA